MAYKGYLTNTEYRNLGGTHTNPPLKEASRHIDSLTFNRIVAAGFNSLTNFQQDIIKDVCMKLADFEDDNQGLLSSPYSSYSINGVSMALDREGYSVTNQGGVIIPTALYEELKQTGLCWRGV